MIFDVNNIQLKYGYEGYRQFPVPQAYVYFQGKGEWLLTVSRINSTFTVLLYRYDTFMSVYLHLLSFFMNMWISDVTLLCQDYAIVRHQSMV